MSSGTVPAIASEPVRQPGHQVVVAAQHAHGDAQVGLGLGRDGRRVGGRGLVDALVLDPVPGHELLADGPELLGVHGPGRAVAGRVELAVAAALLGSEPGHASARGRGSAPQAASSTAWVTGPHSMPCSVPLTRQP